MIGKSRKCKNHEKASARVVDGKLILSLPAANTPVVWQMDLGHAKASALEVRHNQEANLFTLTLKTPKGETMEIAAFNERGRSLEGLLAASQALESAHGQIKLMGANDLAPVYAAPVAAEKTPPRKSRFLSVLLVIAVLLGVFIVWSSLTPMLQNSELASGDFASQSQPMNGVPLSADAYLQNR